MKSTVIEVSLPLSEIALNVNGLNFPVEGQIKRMDQNKLCAVFWEALEIQRHK